MTNRASVLAVLVLPLAACRPKADLVVTGGLVWTGLSSGNPQPGAVAVRGGKILQVGDSVAVAPLIGSRTHVVDARGGLVMPGFADGHTHFIQGGFHLSSIDLGGAATPQEFVRRVKEYAARLQPGEWILRGYWDHTLWRGAPPPPPERIDSPPPPPPPLIHRPDRPQRPANAPAVKAARITPGTPTPPRGASPR